MKKLIGLLIGIGLACVVSADQYYQEVTVICTNGGTAYSDALTVAGILDKVELVKTGLGTQTITVATFTGTTAIDTYVSKQLVAATTGLVRPRVAGTDTGGTALAAAYGAVQYTNVTQAFSIPYERMRIGGNVKVRVASNDDATASRASTNTIRLYLVPNDK